MDVVLELQIVSMGLGVPPESIDPDASYIMRTRAKLIDTSAGPVGPAQSWGYMSEPFDYFELADEDARLLRQATEKGYSEVAHLIVSDLFAEPASPVPSRQASRQTKEEPAQTAKRLDPKAVTSDLTPEQVKQIIRRIEENVERDSIAFLKEKKAIPLGRVRIRLVNWDVTSVLRESFTIKLYYQFPHWAAGTGEFTLRGQIDGEKVTYTEVLGPEARSVP